MKTAGSLNLYTPFLHTANNHYPAFPFVQRKILQFRSDSIFIPNPGIINRTDDYRDAMNFLLRTNEIDQNVA